MAGLKTNESSILPDPRKSEVSVEQALSKRRSIRAFQNKALQKAHIAQLLWSAQGVTGQRGFRTAPSAGALYPLEIYAVAGMVEDLDSAVFKYLPHEHGMIKTRNGDARPGLCRSAFGQRAVLSAPASIAICAVYERVTGKYGRRGVRYTCLEAGHAAQNICLQAVAMGLGTVVIGSFRDEGAKTILNAAPHEEPLYIIPAGFPAKK